MNTSLNEALEPMRLFCNQLAAEIAADVLALKVKQDQLKQVRATLKPFDKGQTPTKTGKSNPSATKEEVAKAAFAVLTEHEPQHIPSDDLKDKVKDKLKAQELASVGAFRYWEKLLQETPEIVEIEKGVYCLAAKQVSVVA